MVTIRGTIGYKYELEMSEGYYWIFYLDGYKNGEEFADYMYRIKEGDRLKVFGENGEILFDGVIDPDDGINRSIPWIPWIQRGWLPNDWINLFFHELISSTGSKPLRAELNKRD